MSEQKDKDFAEQVGDWLAACSVPPPRLTIAPLQDGSGEQLWGALADLGIRRDRPSQSIAGIVQRNPRAVGLEAILTFSAASASLATGQILPELCTTRWNRDAAELVTSPPLTRRYYQIDLDSLPVDHPYAHLDRAKLDGSTVYLQADNSYDKPTIRESYSIDEIYRSTATVTADLLARRQREEREEQRKQEEHKQRLEMSRLNSLGAEGRMLEQMQAQIRALESRLKETEHA